MRASATATTCRPPAAWACSSRASARTSTSTASHTARRIEHNGVTISLHPAGHVLGSAQVRMEHKGEVWVASGDYKVEPDRTCAPFEPVRCDTFITESTFGLPIYRWEPEQSIFDDINAWWRKNAAEGRCSVLFAYSLRQGAAHPVRPRSDASAPIVCHGAVEPLNRVYREGGVDLPPTRAGHRRRQGRAEARHRDRAAVGRRLAVDEALRRLQRRLRQRLDAAARRAPPARRRPRLRAVRPRRLAGPDDGHPRHRGAARDRHARLDPGDGALAAPGRAWTRPASTPSTATTRPTKRPQRQPAAARGRAMREFARLFAELDATTATNRKLEALQAYFSQRRAGERRLGGVLPGRRQAAPGRADQAAAPVRDRIRAARRLAVRRVLPGGRRPGRDHRPRPAAARAPRATSAWPSGCRSASAPCAAPIRPPSATALFGYWNELDTRERFLLTKLIGGGFRVGVSQLLVHARAVGASPRSTASWSRSA